MYTLKNRKKTWFEVTANKYFIAKQSYTKPATEESSMSSVHDHYVGSVSSGTFLLSAIDVNIKSVHSLRLCEGFYSFKCGKIRFYSY